MGFRPGGASHVQTQVKSVRGEAGRAPHGGPPHPRPMEQGQQTPRVGVAFSGSSASAQSLWGTCGKGTGTARTPVLPPGALHWSSWVQACPNGSSRKPRPK